MGVVTIPTRPSVLFSSFFFFYCRGNQPNAAVLHPTHSVNRRYVFFFCWFFFKAYFLCANKCCVCFCLRTFLFSSPRTFCCRCCVTLTGSWRPKCGVFCSSPSPSSSPLYCPRLIPPLFSLSSPFSTLLISLFLSSSQGRCNRLGEPGNLLGPQGGTRGPPKNANYIWQGTWNPSYFQWWPCRSIVDILLKSSRCYLCSMLFVLFILFPSVGPSATGP